MGWLARYGWDGVIVCGGGGRSKGWRQSAGDGRQAGNARQTAARLHLEQHASDLARTLGVDERHERVESLAKDAVAFILAHALELSG